MFTEILKNTLKSSGKSQKDLAEYVGVRQNTVSDWINKGNSPKVEQIYRICDFFEISTDSLFGYSNSKNTINQFEPNIQLSQSFNNLTVPQQDLILSLIQEFNTLNLQQNNKIKLQKQNKVSSNVISLEETSDQNIKLRIYTQKASAGLGKYKYDDDDFTEANFQKTYQSQKADHVIIVEGNSMYPTINDGDYIFIKEQPTIEHNEIGIFVYDDKVYCKRLSIDKKNKVLHLISDNKDYDDILIKNIDDIRTIGKVIL